MVCTGPHIFQHLYGLDWKMSDRSSCGASFGNVNISDLDFADDAVIFAVTMDILMGALQALNEESEPLGLRVSWVKTKIQASNDILDAAVMSVPVWGEDFEVTERFCPPSLFLYVLQMSVFPFLCLWRGESCK